MSAWCMPIPTFADDAAEAFGEMELVATSQYLDKRSVPLSSARRKARSLFVGGDGCLVKPKHPQIFSAKSSACHAALRLDSAHQMAPDLTNEPDQTRFEAMKILNVQEAKTHLSRLMEEAAAGEEILLAKHGKPMVRLSAYRPESEPRKLGGYEKQIWIAEDFDEEDPRILALFHAS